MNNKDPFLSSFLQVENVKFVNLFQFVVALSDGLPPTSILVNVLLSVLGPCV